MFKKFSLPAFVFLVCTSFVFMGCGLSNIEYIDQGTNAQALVDSSKMAELHISAKAHSLDGEESSSRSLSRGPIPDAVTRVTISITGTHFSYPIVYDLIKIGGAWQGIIGDIPAGTVDIVAGAYNSSDELLYQSTAQLDVVDGQVINMNITMLPVTSPDDYNVQSPLITAISVSTEKVNPGGEVHMSVTANDPEGRPLSYIWSPQDVGSFDDFTSPGPTWTAPMTQSVYQLTVTAIDDQFLVDSANVTIDVNETYGAGYLAFAMDSNDFPIINSLTADPTRIDRGEATSISLSVTDPDVGDVLSYSWTTSCSGSFNSTIVAEPTFTADAVAPYGPCTLSVDIGDGTSGITRGSIEINIAEVTPINIGATILSEFQSATTVYPNGDIIFSVIAKDPEGSALTFNWSASAGTFGTPVNTFLDPEYQSEAAWTAPSAGGPFEIEVEVVDAQGFGVTVTFLEVTLN